MNRNCAVCLPNAFAVAQVRQQRQIAGLANKLRQHRQQRDGPDHGQDKHGRRSLPAAGPSTARSHQQQHQQRDRHEAAPEIVENLPRATARRSDSRRHGLVECRDARQQPPGDLPVAANPAMPPADVGG